MVLGVDGTIRKLQTYNNSQYPILSVYLEIPDDKKLKPAVLVERFQGLLKKLTKRDKNLMIDDIDYVQAYLQQYRNTHNYKGIALFSGDNQLWEVVNTEFELSNTLTLDHSADLHPLLQKLAEYQRYLVILTDREKARFFTIYNGTVEDRGIVEDHSVPQNVKANEEAYYGRSDKISRHIQDHMHRHLKFIAQKVEEFIKNKPVAGVIVGGHDTLIHKTEEYLPPMLKKKVIAEFISELNISFSELAEKSMKIIRQLNQGLYPDKNLRKTIINS